MIDPVQLRCFWPFKVARQQLQTHVELLHGSNPVYLKKQKLQKNKALEHSQSCK